MKRFKILVIFIALFAACKKETHFVTKHYYPTGELLSEIPYQIKDSLKDGVYKEYFKNGNIKQIILLKEGNPVDSSMAYYESGELRFKEIRTKDTLYATFFSKTGNGLIKNKFLNTNPPIQIGWSQVLSEKGNVSDSLEYINVNNKGYLNQRLSFSNKNEIIADSSYYYKFKILKIQGTDNYQFKIDYEPSIKDAQVYLVLGDSINSDFSNLHAVRSDTLFMENNSLFTNTLNKPYRKVKGFFYEYHASVRDTVHKDSIRMRIKEKKTFFDEHIIVSDTLKIN